MTKNRARVVVTSFGFVDQHRLVQLCVVQPYLVVAQLQLPVGEPFDPNHHEAILQQPSREHPAQTVTLVTQPGYRLHDRVVRASQVIVSTGPDKSIDQKESKK